MFHGSWVLFILTGWILPRTRRAHLVLAALTVLSWFGLGIFFGFGYCPCTDWHWRVKRARGEVDLPSSYVNYYLNKITGSTWDPKLVGYTVIAVGISVLVLSVVLNWRDWRKRTRGL